MTRFAGRRLLQGLLSLVGILVLVFFLARLTGSPARLYLPEDAPQELVDAFNVQHGYDQPIYVQFMDFVGGVLQLDFGESLLYGGQPAIGIVLQRYPATLQLAFFTVIIAVTAGVVVGVLAAKNPRSAFDGLSRSMSLLALSTPDFWIGIMGITLFAVYLGVLPTSGAGPDWRFWVLPLLTLSLRPAGILAHVVRSSMVDVLQSDYIKIARGKGVPESSILFRHALRNAAIPALTVAGTLAASVINGALVVETVFGWPGVGSLMVDAIRNRDFSVIQAVIVVTASAIVVLNFLIDLGYTRLNPQIRYD